MQRRSFNLLALVGIALVGVVAASTATALAARSAASSFALVANDRYEGECPDCFPVSHDGTFTSGAPFCESGTVVDLGSGPRGAFFRRYTCTDESGSLTLDERESRPGGGEWTIVEGSGRYAGLRGKGGRRIEVLSENPVWVYRTTLQGFADADTVAPSVAFIGASVTKLRGFDAAYLIRVDLSLRDDVEGNTVAYTLSVIEGSEHPRDRRRPELERRNGTTASGSVSTTLDVFATSKRVRSVDLLLSGSDPVGNEVSVVRSVKLPRR